MEVREYFIPNFSNWKVLTDGHHDAFESAFARLKKRPGGGKFKEVINFEIMNTIRFLVARAFKRKAETLKSES